MRQANKWICSSQQIWSSKSQFSALSNRITTFSN